MSFMRMRTDAFVTKQWHRPSPGACGALIAIDGQDRSGPEAAPQTTAFALLVARSN